MKTTTLFASLLVLMISNPALANEAHDHGAEQNAETQTEKHADKEKGHSGEDEHGNEHSGEKDKHGHADHEEEGGVELSQEQLNAAGITVITLQPQALHDEISAPGEVVFNAYASTKITPLISAKILKRRTRLGQQVKKGQTLVTLSSVEMAEAQGDLLVADREWQRVKKLGRKVVSAKRYSAAQITRQQAVARVLAYGMSIPQVDTLLKESNPENATGKFDLWATQNGTVTSDDFIVGEIVEPGRVLFNITDESSLWVEARLTPEDAYKIHEQSPAMIIVGKDKLKGKVTQIHHTLDESTRTLAVRITVPNRNDRLHPGLFVQARIQTNNVTDTNKRVLSMPLDAVLRAPDGDWQVFVEEEPGHFKPEEVDVIRTVGDQVVIAGIAPGTRVVASGAFFVQSEIAKGGFEIHNH